jgi:hypothetical protein
MSATYGACENLTKFKHPITLRKPSRGDLAEDGVWNEFHWTKPSCCEYWNGISDVTCRKRRPTSPDQGLYLRTEAVSSFVQYRSRKPLRLTSMTSRFTSSPWVRENLVSFEPGHLRTEWRNGRACSMNGGEGRRIRRFGEETWEKELLRRPRRRWLDNIKIFRKWDVGVWIGSSWLTTGTFSNAVMNVRVP